MDKSADPAYKPRARKVPGGDSVAEDTTNPNEPLVLREPKKYEPPAPVKWRLTDQGWEQVCQSGTNLAEDRNG